MSLRCRRDMIRLPASHEVAPGKVGAWLVASLLFFTRVLRDGSVDPQLAKARDVADNGLHLPIDTLRQPLPIATAACSRTLSWLSYMAGSTHRVGQSHWSKQWERVQDSHRLIFPESLNTSSSVVVRIVCTSLLWGGRKARLHCLCPYSI